MIGVDSTVTLGSGACSSVAGGDSWAGAGAAAATDCSSIAVRASTDFGSGVSAIVSSPPSPMAPSMRPKNPRSEPASRSLPAGSVVSGSVAAPATGSGATGSSLETGAGVGAGGAAACVFGSGAGAGVPMRGLATTGVGRRAAVWADLTPGFVSGRATSPMISSDDPGAATFGSNGFGRSAGHWGRASGCGCGSVPGGAISRAATPRDSVGTGGAGAVGAAATAGPDAGSGGATTTGADPPTVPPIVPPRPPPVVRWGTVAACGWASAAVSRSASWSRRKLRTERRKWAILKCPRSTARSMGVMPHRSRASRSASALTLALTASRSLTRTASNSA